MKFSKQARLTPKHLSIEELWEQIAAMANNRVQDNNLCDSYPLHTRMMQLHTLKSLIQTVEDTHNKMQAENPFRILAKTERRINLTTVVNDLAETFKK